MTNEVKAEDNVKKARIYKRVSTSDQSTERQNALEDQAVAAGYHIVGVYTETASGARADRPELLRMINDLRPGEVVIAENIDRISRLPVAEAERLIESIKAKGARLSIPGVVDLSDLVERSDPIAKEVLTSVQSMLLRVLLAIAREDYLLRRERQRQGIEIAKAKGKYRGRTADTNLHDRIVALRKAGYSIRDTAKMASCSTSQVTTVWRQHKQKIAKS